MADRVIYGYMFSKLLTASFLTLAAWFGCGRVDNVGPAPSSKDLTTATPQIVSTPQSTPEPTMPILKEIARFKDQKAEATAQEIANYANSILPTYGFEYDLDLEKIISKKIKDRQTKNVKVEGDSSRWVSFDLDLVAKDGKRKKLNVTAPAEGVCCCGYYYTPIPVTKITPKELTVVINKKEVVVSRPKEMPVVQEYIFGKESANPTKMRSWEAPYETYPFGISDDGQKLYVKTDIDQILLEIAADGSLKFVPGDTQGIVTNGEDLNKLPPPKIGEILNKSGELGLMRYVLNGVSYIVEFPYPCT